MTEDMQAKLTDIQTRYAHELMEKPNVVGVGIGIAKVEETYTEEMALIVVVERKVPEDELAADELIPHTIEGIRVDVQEVGQIQAF